MAARKVKRAKVKGVNGREVAEQNMFMMWLALGVVILSATTIIMMGVK